MSGFKKQALARAALFDAKAGEGIAANFSSGTLSVLDKAADGIITPGRDRAGHLTVGNGTVPILGGTPSVASTALIQGLGRGGNDTVRLNEADGARPRADLSGACGSDVITAGSGADMPIGGPGTDVLDGGPGSDAGIRSLQPAGFDFHR